MARIMDTKEKIKERFVIYATERGNALSIGDYKKANKLHKKLHDLYNQAKEQNLSEVFMEFLNDKNENIKLWAATFTLKTEPDLAKKTLKVLSESTHIVGLSAETTLVLWQEGKLNLL
jgi:hypothetical protein